MRPPHYLLNWERAVCTLPVTLPGVQATAGAVGSSGTTPSPASSTVVSVPDGLASPTLAGVS